MSIEQKDVLWVARLSRLEVPEAELGRVTEQLGAILDYVDQLKGLDTEGVEEMAHPLPVQNVFRDDEERPSLEVDAALANAPARNGDFFSVPAVLESHEDTPSS